MTIHFLDQILRPPQHPFGEKGWARTSHFLAIAPEPAEASRANRLRSGIQAGIHCRAGSPSSYPFTLLPSHPVSFLHPPSLLPSLTLSLSPPILFPALTNPLSSPHSPFLPSPTISACPTHPPHPLTHPLCSPNPPSLFPSHTVFPPLTPFFPRPISLLLNGRTRLPGWHGTLHRWGGKERRRVRR